MLDATKFHIKAIMIDLDGTLMHTAPEIARAANAMLTVLNLPNLPTKQIESYIGEGAAVLIQRCITGQRNVAPDAALFAEAQSIFYQQYAAILTDSKPYPHVVEALTAMQRAGFTLACITNKPATFTLPLLAASGLHDYFTLVVSGDTLPKKKPEPDQIFYTCKALGVEVWQSLLIGDSNTDILAAKNAGCYVFTVPYGYNQGLAIDDNCVDMKIAHLGEVVNLVTLATH